MACSKTALSTSVKDFTFDIYKNIVIPEPADNAFLSTTSIMVVMTMLHVGARNNTEKQMTKALRLDNINKETLLSEVKQFVEVLEEGGQSVKLETANKIYPHVKSLIEDDYIKGVSLNFKTEVKGLDYSKKTEESRKEINKWVEDQTNGKIKDLLPSGSIKSNTAMVVVNAIYFKGSWDEKFDAADTRKADFYINGNKTVQVDMMGKTLENVKYTKSDELACKALEIPYIGKNIGMVILLPDDSTGLSALEKSLSTALLQNIMGQMRTRKVTVQLPKFKLEASYKIKDLLIALGMVDLFDDKTADLSGMGKDLFVSEVFHKAFVEVNEEGTEAAAATGAVVVSQMYIQPTTFIADHPFLFMIWDHRLDVPLFIGRLANPKV